MLGFDVVVVGAGPAGCATTLELARAGLRVLLAERRRSKPALPKATVLSLRSMELLRSWGLEEQMGMAADEVEMTMRTMPSAARASAGQTLDVGYPDRAQSAVLSPTRPLCVAQDLLETVLMEHVSRLGNVTVARGCEVIAVTPGDSAASVRIRDTSGQLHHIEASYVVGADGARSAVRAALGIKLRGPEVLFTGARVEFRGPVWDVLGGHRHLIYAITEPGAAGVLLPAGQGDRWVYAATYGPGGAMGARPSESDMVERMVRATDLAEDQVRPTRFDRFTSGAQVADQFSLGRVFLVGDAAHRVTPRGGTGLNLAMADGHDLGWKLGWVRRGWAPSWLLDTYELERRPAVLHNVRRSADPVGASRQATSETQIDLGGRIKHLWVTPGLSTLDLLADGLTLLLAEPNGHCKRYTEIHRGPPVTVVPIDPLTTRALGLGSSGAALLRPDGVPVTTWSTRPPPSLVTAAVATVMAAHPPAPIAAESAA